ncbi:116 kda u5 small nuclear ribonucleoprotein component-like [Plasmopara halstedii]|uniref:116 kDa u5 small nuclear ribonucleoprotein component-like n=1 Tax=Plasmopara halstedii TaxID=4781 RepID=A0A0N7L529_PLAHL|nr:116 kda u5 small nuclear ribonucleoprotein component-like [Plasmopara halstedii]CEG40323.1 116 kda u5 small nuclear ribonucleoprotein component-like [Plasmopara halstedii]|eukprot:XP_024576692.1 116 kda u5 small nuclear ribonucleoprotein component-like [Plasmopara halstedii]
MEESLYDEFGNYIGPELHSSEDESSSTSDSNPASDNESEEAVNEAEHQVNALALHNEEDNAIVLHEDKQYYPDASEVYGDAEMLVMEEDAQEIEKPIIEPVKTKNFSVLEQKTPRTTYSTEFLTSLMNHPQLIRHVAILGDLHHGKTLFTDLLVQQTHVDKWNPALEKRYTDTRKDEQERKVSIKSTPVSLVLPTSKGKHFLLNVLDCPGHVNFSDESTAALQVADGAVLVVDAIEGVMMNTERLVKAALRANVAIVLVLNKVDRLIIELKLPPADAYFKLLHTIEEINAVIIANTPADQEKQRVSPELGNVCFASGQHGWSFTLESFAQIYAETYPSVPASELAARFWGDKYFNPQTRTFTKKSPYPGALRSFVQFVLEPLYKMYSKVLDGDPKELSATLRAMGLRLRKEELNLNPRPLLKLVLGKFFGTVTAGFMDMVVKYVPSPLLTAKSKLENLYTGNQSSEMAVVRGIQSCDPKAPLMVNIVKLYSSPDGTTFSAFGRIYSGEVCETKDVKVLGEAYSTDDDEDMCTRTIESVCIAQGRYKIQVNRIPAGNWVLLEGVDASITKSATITDADEQILQDEEVGIFRPIHIAFNMTAVMKLAVEPLNPAELPKMLEGLRKVSKSYPLVRTKVEESGEHVILCTGELAADCILHDLRRMYAEIEIKVADPVVAFCETVIETSAVQCFAETPNQKNKISMIAEPLDAGLAQDIEAGAINLDMDTKQVANFFQTRYKWDVLAARSVWAFGPESNGPNVLLDDTLATEVDKSSLNMIKNSIVQGFQWSCREGPLCDEPIRNTKFKILDATIASEPIHRGGGQVIPTARRVAYSAFLTATPRMLEPMYALEIQCPADTVSSLYQVLSRRRGHITHDAPKAGSPLYTVRGFVPVIESFGLETDLRVFTQGQAFLSQVFDHWAVVPGDPLDTNVVLRPLEPAPVNDLAREFMVKTRRRKGLSEDVNVSRYFDEPMLRELARHEVELQHLI